ncbi:hypothetical protein [Clostridium aminobutyricum]|uniref:Uncharacterized protein n=1 Tax=Clostridium aminobutyricum TaxID=33953 RepID=A0A939D9Q8_CLOAM|nr:hypothetical protein [Clostridium aminobutyricum]MBN7773662.1 hypothetical protein [Clostridium aminobutyricum]
MIHKKQYEGIPSWQINIILRLSNAWKELAIFSRLYLISSYTGLEDRESISDRLAEIPIELGNTIRLFFGDDIAARYTDLVNLQVSLIKNLIDAQVRGDDAAVKDNINRLYGTADMLAALLSNANPFWTQSEMRNLRYTYLSLMLEEITTFITKNYATSIDIFDRLLSYSTVLGDYYAKGLYDYIMANRARTP